MLKISYFFDVENNFFVSDFSRDGRFLVMETVNGEIKLMDIKSMLIIKTHTIDGYFVFILILIAN